MNLNLEFMKLPENISDSDRQLLSQFALVTMLAGIMVTALVSFIGQKNRLEEHDIKFLAVTSHKIETVIKELKRGDIDTNLGSTEARESMHKITDALFNILQDCRLQLVKNNVN